MLPDTVSFSRAQAVSGDGQTLVGDSQGGIGGFVWTPGDALVDLVATVPSGAHEPSKISADKTTIAGFVSPSDGRAARTVSGGAVEVMSARDAASFARVSQMSVDGRSVVGNSDSNDGIQAFRRDTVHGMIGLGFPQPGRATTANDASADGATVVGRTLRGASGTALVRTESGGLQPLAVLLTSLGVDPTGSSVEAAYGISADGLRIASFGTNPAGNTEAFLGTIPEQSTALLVGLELLRLSRTRSAIHADFRRASATDEPGLPLLR